LTRIAANTQNEIAVLTARKTKRKKKNFPSRSAEKLITNSFTIKTTQVSKNNNYRTS
jgi:hypothetical protein